MLINSYIKVQMNTGIFYMKRFKKFNITTLGTVLLLALSSQAQATTYTVKQRITGLKVQSSSNSNAGGGPIPDTTPPVIEVSSPVLNFGSVAIGQPLTKSFIILNSGDEAATFSKQISFSSSTGASFAQLTSSCSSSLNPAQSCGVSVTFTPTSESEVLGAVELSIMGMALKTVALNGVGTGTPIGVLASKEGSSTNFGTVYMGGTKSQTFVFSNTGNGTDKGVYTSIIGANLAFGQNSCGQPGAAVDIAPNGTCNIEIIYSPTDGSALNGGLSVSSMSGSKSLTFIGSGYYDQYASSVKAYLNFESPVGTTNHVDSAPNPVSISSTVPTSDQYASAGMYSGYFDGTTGIQYDPSIDHDITSGDFTVEFNVKALSLNNLSYIAAQVPSTGTTGWYIAITSTGAIQFRFVGTRAVDSPEETIVVGEAAKISLQKTNGTLKVFKNGIEVLSKPFSSPSRSAQSSGMRIGMDHLGNNRLNGYLDEFRLTKGVARY